MKTPVGYFSDALDIGSWAWWQSNRVKSSRYTEVQGGELRSGAKKQRLAAPPGATAGYTYFVFSVGSFATGRRGGPNLRRDDNCYRSEVISRQNLPNLNQNFAMCASGWKGHLARRVSHI
jgi:hypothetical protein